MIKTLIVVDMQNDFVSGSLGSETKRQSFQMFERKLKSIGIAEIELFLRVIHITKIIWTLQKERNCP